MSSSSRCCGAEPSRRRVLRWLLASSLAAPAGVIASVERAAAAPVELQSEFDAVRLQGSGRLRFLGQRVYEIRLWAPVLLAEANALEMPAAIEIEYARSLAGIRIAERSLAEMRRGGSVAALDGERWLARMKQLFPDVREGDRITGVHRPGEGARFHVNGRFVGELREADFARRFFGIWLSPQTSEPELRGDLLGIRR